MESRKVTIRDDSNSFSVTIIIDVEYATHGSSGRALVSQSQARRIKKELNSTYRLPTCGADSEGNCIELAYDI